MKQLKENSSLVSLESFLHNHFLPHNMIFLKFLIRDNFNF